MFVEDHGVNNQDSAAFLHNICNQVPTKFVIGWFHTHVRGTPLMLSAVDCHTQFLYETAVFKGIKAFVLHLPSRSLVCFQLTETGLNALRLCTLQYPWKATIQHPECFQSSFYFSLKHLLKSEDTSVTFIDATESKPFSQPLGTYKKFLCGNKLPTTKVLESCQPSSLHQTPDCALKCTSCRKSFRDLRKKRKHLSRTKCIESVASKMHFPSLFHLSTSRNISNSFVWVVQQFSRIKMRLLSFSLEALVGLCTRQF